MNSYYFNFMDISLTIFLLVSNYVNSIWRGKIRDLNKVKDHLRGKQQ